MPALRNKKARQKLREEFYERVKEKPVTPDIAVKTFRKILGLSQEEFAKKQGVGLLALRQVETSKGNPTVETLKKLLAGSGLGLTVSLDL